MATRYMFLLYGDESGMADVTPEQWDQMLQAHNAWAESVQAAGATIVSGEALAPSTTSTTVRKTAGTPTVTDGPFAETKEALGGYYTIDCADLDQALALAHTCPIDVVEVRPVIAT
ncbi:MAG TPA: YciI family protein [Candidatus Nanopelagicales bacterium]|nr:YciI family protein [Candidatus Nanopelagicales bacterium]